jgi:nitrate reductase cytochrome c-type subunit
MKKLVTLLFAAILAFSLSMPVFAQETGQTEAAPKAEKKATKKMHKEKKAKTEKKAKKEKKEKKGEEPPPAQ